MSISIGTAVKQIGRLACLHGWRDLEKPAREELAMWLARAAKTDWQASAAVERWLETERYLPSPSDLHRICGELPLKPEAAPRSDDCPLCRGAGRESYWVLRTIISRWPDTGRIRQQTVERIPPWPGRENEYLIEQPRALNQDGTLGWLECQITDQQTIVLVSGICRCEYGQHLRVIAARAEA